MLITTVSKNRAPVFQNPAYALEAIRTLYKLKHLYSFALFGFVIMPDHCHLLLRVYEPHKVSTVMKQFKSGVAFNIGLGPIWQSRFHIKIPDDLRSALQYIHTNPVEAKLTEEAVEYPWSSANEKWQVDNLHIE